ncbi:MAG: hypothetical protein LBL46_00025 [Rickettsiales bacterium]|jgi:hypothetical protein|nr:hypothetical protein [Rickettsiales bacterium]
MSFRKLIFAVLFCALGGGVPAGARAANGQDFQMASQLLTAARAGNIPMVEKLVNAGADVNFTDSTGLSVVCTAIMNNDLKAAQILQVYGADASRCDSQIKKYKTKLPKENSGGLFSGLGNAQNMTLAAGGAALVVGGVYLLGDGVFGAGGGKGGGGSGAGGDRPTTGGGSGGGNTDTATPLAVLAYGPNEWNPDANKPKDGFDLGAEINALFPAGAGSNFAYMSANGQQNYLLMTAGYSPTARGYLGQATMRNSGGAGNTPIKLADGLGTGGAPIPVALITANGVNPAGSIENKQITYATCVNAGDAGCAHTTTRYGNLASGAEITTGFDLSGAGSVFNPLASGGDNLLAKMIVGETAGTSGGADFVGYMPNGQLLLYRTGGGKKWADITGGAVVGSRDGVAKTITIDATTYAYTEDTTGYYPRITMTEGSNTTYGYFMDGLLYIGDKAYSIDDGTGAITFARQATAARYQNFDAMLDGLSKTAFASSTGGAKGGVIANAALIPEMKDAATPTIGAIASPAKPADKQSALLSLIKQYYDVGSGEESKTAAANFFGAMSGGAANNPFVIFSAGEYKTPAANNYWNTQEATFENGAPIAVPGLNHHFLTAAAVQYSAGTANVSSASGAVKSGKYQLSNYTIGDTTYRARACGTAGTGTSAIDPWCFSSPGVTGEQAVATLAGSVGAIQSAFNYMTNDQIFLLLALTADGKFHTAQDLTGMYELPGDIAARLPAPTADNYYTEWKRLFGEVYGYGLVNLTRATTPNTKLMFYSSNNSSRNGYWSETPSAARSATTFRASTAFGARAATLNLPMFDIITSADGTQSMPRAFDYSVDFGGAQHGLNLTDLLSEVSLENREQRTENMFQLTASGELKKGRIDFGKMSFDYQRTNGAATFGGGNPVFGLVGEQFNSHYSDGVWDFNVMTGSMTDAGLLESDPAISDNFRAARLGGAWGFDSGVRLGALSVGAGYMNEDATLLGAETGGLFDLGNGRTAFARAELKLGAFSAKYTAARTTTTPGWGFVESVGDLYSDAYSVGADFGKWSFNISRPLAIISGDLKYMHTDYDIVQSAGGYELDATAALRSLDLAPAARETRFAVAYRPDISERTKLALGFVERLNPNNAPGREEILMLKINHIW